MKYVPWIMVAFLKTEYLQVTTRVFKNHGFPMFSISLALELFFLQINKITSYLISKNLRKQLVVRTAGGHYKNNLTSGITFKGVTNGIIVNSCCHAGHRVRNSNVISAFTIRTVFNLSKRNLFVDTKKLKQVSLRLLLGIGLTQVGLGCWTLNTALAKDLGTHGHTFEIAEPDLLKQIEYKLQALQKDGSLAKHQEVLLKKAAEAIQFHQPVPGITKATQSRTFYYDPSFIVPYDLKDHKGRVFQKAGTRFNPLSFRSLSSPLVFIAGEDETQVSWAQVSLTQVPQTSPSGIEETHLNTNQHPKIILISGSPFTLMERWKQPVYFDQGGKLTKKLKIKHVPAVVVQEGLKIKISEIALEDTQ